MAPDFFTSAPQRGLLDQLRARIDVQAALKGGASYLEFIATDRAFHRLMYGAVGAEPV